MTSQAHAIGQAIYIRTDTVDYEVEAIAFRSLEEMVEVCSKPRPKLTLEKIIIYSMVASGEPVALTLGFIASSRGQRPGHLELVND
ncbi:MAG: hypothetical protein FJ386_11970 [Verrucomicrobia bacterium]|nr:hypothetical protein [Verrucomicrobiota bacterium]